jgi:hypothetical protein
MTFTPISAGAIVSGGTISKSAFGDLVRLNFDDHEARLAAAESGLTAVSGIQVAGGRRWHSGSAILIPNGQAAGVPSVHPFDTVETTEGGYSYSAGVFTIGSTGVYDLVMNCCGVVSSTTGYYVQGYISKVSAGSPTGARWGYAAIGIGTSGQRTFLTCVARDVALTAGDTVAGFVNLDIAATATAFYTPSVPVAPAGLTIATVHPSNFAIQRVR